MTPPVDIVREEWHIHHTRTNIVAPEEPPDLAASAVTDYNECQRYTVKLISPNIKNDKRTKLPI
jgi:hypothetical protein